MLRMNSPAPTSATSESQFPKQPAGCAKKLFVPSDRSPRRQFECFHQVGTDAFNAGATPKSTPVIKEMPA